ncbi:hypothetical protein VOLCADRAFT_70991 [Volvox carteri f. nagariensis]|uniref:Retrotransposon gag domain-containing protein n=1 Tax=Volvox carteri f. nagariensis TaxID=3068 RepID=D8ULB0_VOLCA|nr:uncharacterized protein VOLCADRAFT_70991 [Volvox carteri f. nagariensis]EFJ39489.1 hypothetical protein VOLCADRAFT_70991 [Volvox carteri f. nagariensis]|eukprot:XP_002959446.1 hypothetical protein VOLCADRAFT_70991 [Volvox carteri f. nagariensis]
MELGLEQSLLAEPCNEEQIRQSRKVINLLIKNVKDHHLPMVTGAANAKKAWDALGSMFAANNNARKVSLRQEFSRFKMVNGEPLPMYFARARQLQTD